MIKIVFLCENKTDNPLCTAEHGLSIYIETSSLKLLFDTGATNMFSENAKSLNVDLSTVDACVISHGHYDHTGGVPLFCEINKKAKVYIHESGFGEAYGQENGKLDEKPCSILWDNKVRQKLNDRIYLTSGVFKLSEDVIISGEIPEEYGFEPTEDFFEKQPDGTLRRDPMKHEQILIVREKDGLYIFSGCSHKGVMPAIRYIKALFPDEGIRLFAAGMHLYNSDKEACIKVVEELKKAGVGTVMPVHCTGIEAICDMKSAFGDACIVATAGGQYEF